jgi:hypothetical protein
MNLVLFEHLYLPEMHRSIVKGGKAMEQVRENAAPHAYLFRLDLRE